MSTTTESIEDVDGRVLVDGNRYRCTWTGGGYDVHRLDGQGGNRHWRGLPGIWAGREWSERALVSEMNRRIRDQDEGCY